MSEAVRVPTLSVTIPGRPPSLGNSRLHWAAKARLVADARDKAWGPMVSLRNALGMPVAKKKRKLFIAVYVCGVLFDQDNLHSAIKPLADAACLAGWLRSDAPEWCEFEVKQKRVQHRDEQRVVIEVSE